VPLAASVLADWTFSPIHPVLLKYRTYPVPTLLPVKGCCDDVFWIIMAMSLSLISRGTIFPKRLFDSLVPTPFANQLVVRGTRHLEILTHPIRQYYP
jgi:hypothetical protein